MALARLHRPEPRSPAGPSPDILARVAALERQVAALVAGRGARDAGDVALLVAIAADVGSLPFSARELWRRRRHAPELAAAIEVADLCSVREVGGWLRRMSGAETAGWTVERLRKSRHGMAWRVVRL
jgi:hypothetical protein